MATDRFILCGPVPHSAPPVDDRHPVTLDIYSPGGNVNLRLEEVRRALWRDIPPELRDLLDLAVYVYCADQATTRAGGGNVDGPEIGRGWRRRLHLRVAVRRPHLWESLRDRLTAALSFLSEDEYCFEFRELKRDRSLDGFIDFRETPFDGRVEEVVMFSGGLDSLAGAVQESLAHKRQVLLVNHRSTSKRATRHEALVRELEGRAGRLAPLHFPVWANKKKALGREYTQRTRSFLFAALGTLFSAMIGLNRVRFYENGVVSLNLPPVPQVVGARASRTTHPRVLALLGDLMTGVVGRPFTFENPFLWKTKTDVVEILREAGCGDLVNLSTSCGHTWELTREHTHCGMCSQCIDRRLAVLAAHEEAHDPAGAYKTDPVLGSPPNGYARTMLVAYMELAERVERMTAAGFVARFGELARVLDHGPGGPAAVALQAHALYRKHAEQVRGAVNRAVAENVDAVTRRTLPPDCLLRLVYDPGAEGVQPVAPAAPIQPQGNYFERRGDYWAIRFGFGKEKCYKAHRGFDYLRILLEHPREDFDAPDLVSRVRRPPGPEDARVTSAGDAAEAGLRPLVATADEVLDDEGVSLLLARLEQNAERRGTAEESDSQTRLDEVDELDEEDRRIRDCLARARGIGGRARGLGDVRNQIRNRVCNAVRRAIEQIDKYDKPLAAHLAAPILTLGYALRYQPDSTLTWHFID